MKKNKDVDSSIGFEHDDQTKIATLLEQYLAPGDESAKNELGPAFPNSLCIMAECVDDRHPFLHGRIKVRITNSSGNNQELWVPTLHGLSVRAADRVLLVRPVNVEEWVVSGVVDGFANRPRIEKQSAGQLELKLDEALRIVSTDGEELIEFSRNQDGPVIRLFEPDVRVEFAGKLAVAAEQIDFEATRGQVNIKASDDVTVQGELIKLN